VLIEQRGSVKPDLSASPPLGKLGWKSVFEGWRNLPINLQRGAAFTLTSLSPPLQVLWSARLFSSHSIKQR